MWRDGDRLVEASAWMVLARNAALLCAWHLPYEPDDTREQVLQKGWFATMDPLSPGFVTPALDELLLYDAVLVYPNDAFLDPVALGDVLAAYVEAGGGVVLGYGAFSDDQGLGGAFAPYRPLLPGPREVGGVGLLPVISDHPILVGTTLFDAGDGHRTATTGVAPDAVLVATWADGMPLVATLEPSAAGRVVALNLMPSPGTVDAGFWDTESDVDDLLARSLLWATGYEWPFADSCWAGTVRVRDRNCNGVEAADEAPVDLTDPLCAGNIDPASGQPFPSADEYVDYEVRGCAWPVTALDPDGDGFGSGTVEILGEDGILDYLRVLTCDNCPLEPNPLQEDVECDGVGDVCDVCVEVSGGGQNGDLDPWGAICDDCPFDFNLDPPLDGDGDGIVDCIDNCPIDANPDQHNLDGDLIGDLCDRCPTVADLGTDVDGDGIGDGCDNCPGTPNPDQADADRDTAGDVCDPCPLVAAEDPDNADFDALADVCDPCPDHFSEDPAADGDGDGVGDACDLCAAVVDPTNADLDRDGQGDVCDLCPGVAGAVDDSDGDGFGDPCDRCPNVADSQHDADGDDIGDACDACPLTVSERGAPDRDADGWPDVCDGCPDEPGAVCPRLLLRGGGQGCRTAPSGPFWGLLILAGLHAVVRCSSRR